MSNSHSEFFSELLLTPHFSLNIRSKAFLVADDGAAYEAVSDIEYCALSWSDGRNGGCCTHEDA